jgi:hypothetical protein
MHRLGEAMAGKRSHVRSTARGRPRIHHERWSKVSVVLMDRQVKHLDRLAAEIRARTGRLIHRASLIRTLIDDLFERKPGDARLRSEADLRTLLIRSPAPRKRPRSR